MGGQAANPSPCPPSSTAALKQCHADRATHACRYPQGRPGAAGGAAGRHEGGGSGARQPQGELPTAGAAAASAGSALGTPRRFRRPGEPVGRRSSLRDPNKCCRISRTPAALARYPHARVETSCGARRTGENAATGAGEADGREHGREGRRRRPGGGAGWLGGGGRGRQHFDRHWVKGTRGAPCGRCSEFGVRNLHLIVLCALRQMRMSDAPSRASTCMSDAFVHSALLCGRFM